MRKLSSAPKRKGRKPSVSRSGKKMRKLSGCNTLKSGKKRSRKSCKRRSKTCSWHKGNRSIKGYCAGKSVRKSK